ncbi:MAG: cation-translocating P-type ATPase [Pseudomonadota bacterium]
MASSNQRAAEPQTSPRVAESLWHSKETTAVLLELDVDHTTGLDQQEVQRRLETYGYNELEQAEAISPLALLLGQFRNLLIVVLLGAAGLSAMVGEIVDALIILIIVLFSALLGFVQEYRAERAVEALKRMLAPTARVLRGRQPVMVSAKELVPGDIVLLEAGDRVSADIRLLETHALRCDEAPLTGESAPVAKQTGALGHDTPVPERTNSLFGGTTITYGRGRGVVTETGMRSQFGRIALEVAAVEVDETPLEKRTREIGKWLAVVSLSVCALVIVISLIRGAISHSLDLDFLLTMIMFAVALAVAAVPEALAAIVTGALAIGMRSMAKHNALVKRMPAVETLGSTTVICSDKTGTLTRGEMTIRRILCGTRSIEVTGAGYLPEGELQLPAGLTQDDPGLRLLLKGGVLCNDSELLQEADQWTIRGDPTEGAFLVLAEKAGISANETRARQARSGEVPFSSERKRMTTTHQDKDETVAFMKGAPEVILARCGQIADGDQVRGLNEAERGLILQQNEAMAGAALRVLALAYRRLAGRPPQDDDELESEMVFLGLVGMMDPPRDEAMEAVETCRRVGIRSVMITGDHQLTARAVAHELGIFREGDLVINGEQLAAMSEEELTRIVERVTVYARVSPMDKLKIVRAWKARGEVVAMTGDGVNDAPALKHADIGVAMGITGTDVAREAADMVLADDNFSTIVKAIQQGRWIYDNIKKYLAYLLESNIAEVVVIGGIVLLLGPEFLPLLPAAILYLNLATDGLPALALGIAPPDPDIMQRPPRPPNQSVFDWDVKSFILRAMVIEIPVYYWIFFSHLDDWEHARTMLFFMFIGVEFVIALNCRSLAFSIFSVPPHKWLIIALVWELLLIVLLVQIPAVRQAFGITLPSLADLALISAIGLMVMAVIEASKILLRRYKRAVAAG